MDKLATSGVGWPRKHSKGDYGSIYVADIAAAVGLEKERRSPSRPLQCQSVQQFLETARVDVGNGAIAKGLHRVGHRHLGLVLRLRVFADDARYCVKGADVNVSRT